MDLAMAPIIMTMASAGHIFGIKTAHLIGKGGSYGILHEPMRAEQCLRERLEYLPFVVHLLSLIVSIVV